MYKLLEEISVELCTKRKSSDMQLSMMSCATNILHTKSNLNIMVLIDMCILKALHWKNLVIHTKKHYNQLSKVTNVIMCIQYILFNNRNQDRDIIDVHSKRIIEFLKNIQLLFLA